MPFWNTTSTTLDNQQMYVNNTYKDSNGNNKLTTITPTNKTGYVPIDSNSTDPIVKKTSYSVQNDGKITYQYDDGTGNKIQYNSIQEIANDFGITEYTPATTAKIKDSMQKNLTKQVDSYNTTNPTSKIGPSLANPQQADQQTGSEPKGNTTASEFNQGALGKAIGDGGIRGKYGDYRYPLNAKFGDQDCIKFSMYRYAPKKFSVNKNLGAFTPSDKGSPMGTVTLPIQPSITDSNVVSWGESELNAIQALAGASAMAAIQKGPEGLGQSLEEISKGLRQNKGDIAAGLGAYFAGEAAGANKDFLTRATGAVLNNNLELLFKGPSLRSFTFTFSMSAREQPEAEMIRKIIRFFKQGMSVKRSSSSLFLKSPNIFDIQYLHQGKEHAYINQIKTCALQSCVVNYTPAGNYATYEDGAMTQYDLTLTFGEIEPLFDDDYEKLDGNADTKIGY